MGKSKALPALYITVAQMGFLCEILLCCRVHTRLSNQPIYRRLSKATLGSAIQEFYRYAILTHAFAWYVSASEGFVEYTAASIFQL